MSASGPKRSTITIQRRTTLQVGTGEPRTEWLQVGSRWAENLATPGEEIWSGRERSGRIPTVFKIRFPRDFAVTPDMRILFEGKLFNIISAIDADGRKVEMLITCEELVGEPATL